MSCHCMQQVNRSMHVATRSCCTCSTLPEQHAHCLRGIAMQCEDFPAGWGLTPLCILLTGLGGHLSLLCQVRFVADQDDYCKPQS